VATMRKETGKRGGRGFAGMDPAKQREIASIGGRTAHQTGRAHTFSSEEARAAGKRRQQLRREAAAT
jgi:general stress protein YciG